MGKFGFNFAILAFFILIYGCKTTGVHDDIDRLIVQFDHHDFGIPPDASILLRSSLFFEEQYVVGKFEGNRPMYFVTYNTITNSISKIDSSMLLRLHEQRYFSKEELTNLVNSIRNYGFFMLSSTAAGDILLNPFVYDSPPLLYRTKVRIESDTIRNGYIYKRYKDNWYINTNSI